MPNFALIETKKITVCTTSPLGWSLYSLFHYWVGGNQCGMIRYITSPAVTKDTLWGGGGG